MVQPPGFVNLAHPTHVCKLHKSLYALKQALHAWFNRSSTFLLSLGFSRKFYVAFEHQFDIKDLGPLTYFLGLQLVSHNGAFYLNQLKYVHDLLHKSNLQHAKPSSTPFAAKSVLTASAGDLLTSLTEYRELVGSPQYLTFTRPNISFAVNTVAQFISSPRSPHMVAVKRILRYVKGTIDFGLHFTPQDPSTRLIIYSYTNWAGCPNFRRSTTGYLIYLGSNLMSWCSRKQPTVSRSSVESEYCALAYACAKSSWLCSLLHELGV
ncbi:PREDICTED: uncharacterized mitochondrial protein AtMg00810-like [Prunus mume]|uniref:Uncharacterized mitochondrial protein AtMg00810-like n=1 Tax=Prunus mume TaxID=102107 RepID=A0ABM1LND9_PRUMU|nr:PREDICTED: uncharacterized mitochondrial protein AtMg00810-like [Prunus mume]